MSLGSGNLNFDLGAFGNPGVPLANVFFSPSALIVTNNSLNYAMLASGRISV